MSSESLLVILLDESSNMKEISDKVINGFNKFVNFIDSMGSVDTILIKFNTSQTISFRGRFKDMPLLTNENYNPEGETALNDSVVYAINLIDDIKTEFQKVIFATFTNVNNCLQIADLECIGMIDTRKMDGWAFMQGAIV